MIIEDLPGFLHPEADYDAHRALVKEAEDRLANENWKRQLLEQQKRDIAVGEYIGSLENAGLTDLGALPSWLKRQGE